MKLKAFVSGKLIDMSEVQDEMFSQKMMGDGVAIEPTGDTVVAPADAEITIVMNESLHAVGLRLDNDADILIHIGIDIVKLDGKGFKLLVKQGDKVTVGTPLVKFDSAVIKESSYKDTVIMAVTNFGEYPQMKKSENQSVKVGESVIMTF